MKTKYLLPYKNNTGYLNKIPKNSILFSRSFNDFQKDCLIFKQSNNQLLSIDKIPSIKEAGFKLCYVYDMFDFENREFSIQGFKIINKDIKQIIDIGYDYILVSNPFVIEILTNEYKNDINVIVSANLEINSERGKLFFDVLNDITSISHIIISHNHLNKSKMKSICNIFPTSINFILEIDRFVSNNQIIHEHYYNVLYGYYNVESISYLKHFITKNIAYSKSSLDMYYGSKFIYKFGELSINCDTILDNINYFENNEINKINIIDKLIF